MVIRELKDGSCIASTQEDHAELSAQFAAHWGNKDFARLRPYDTMVFATTYHDSGYREWEGNPPMNVEKGRPYAHREEIPSFEAVELRAYARNIDWVSSQDRYAGLLVSMHRTGLWQNRYQTFTSPKGRLRERSAEIKTALQKFEAQQQEMKQTLGGGSPSFDNELWFNYRALQIYDLLSLYFCCDGYADDSHFKEERLAPIRLSYDSPAEVELRIVPNGVRAVKMEPYPFDVSPLTVSARGRIISPGKETSPEGCLETYHKAPRQLLSFEISQ